MTHPGVPAVLDWMRGCVAGPDADLAAVRASYDAMAEPVPPHMTTERVSTAELTGEWVGAPASPRVVLYFHGGAYTIGSSASHRGLAGRLAEACGARVLIVDYHLAPEHVFPAAVDDAVAAWRALRDQGTAASRIAIGGDSAGAALAIVAAMTARDRGEPPAAVFTFSAWTDLAAPPVWFGDDPVLDGGVLARLAAQYLAGADPRDWRASPCYGRLAGLPPLLMQVGERELLRGDSGRFAAAVRAADGSVELEEYPEMIHVFQMYSSRLEEARRAIERVGTFVRRHVSSHEGSTPP